MKITSSNFVQYAIAVHNTTSQIHTRKLKQTNGMRPTKIMRQAHFFAFTRFRIGRNSSANSHRKTIPYRKVADDSTAQPPPGLDGILTASSHHLVQRSMMWRGAFILWFKKKCPCSIHTVKNGIPEYPLPISSSPNCVWIYSRLYAPLIIFLWRTKKLTIYQIQLVFIN